MKRVHLSARLALGTAAVAAGRRVYRIQPSTPRAATLNFGGIFVAPPGLMACRYDLPRQPVAYFGFDEATAMYETFARRDASLIPLALLSTRSLLTASFGSAGLNLADLGPHAADWPALQAMRYASTQELALDLASAGFDGVLYPSAQRAGSDCLALFGAAAIGKVAVLRTDPLYDAATRRLHHGVVDAARGAELPVI